jgi:hypothetical protein
MKSALPAAAVGVAVAVAASAVGCSPGTKTDGLGLPLRQPVTQDELRAHPESALLYPGSHTVRPIGADEHRQAGDHEPDPAYAGVVASTTVSGARVLGWYDRQLTARGYSRGPYYRPSNQVAGGAWTIPHSREQVQVGIYAPGAAPAGIVRRGGVIYEEILVSYRVTGPPPS